MTVNYNTKLGVDLPSWQWLNQFTPGNSFHGTSHAFDGKRYIYWAVQYGSGTVASTAALWRFDTYTNGWQLLSALATSYTGVDVEFDAFHNVLWFTNGNGGTAWYVFNCSSTATVSIPSVGVVSLAPLTLSAALAPVLPAASSTGTDFEMPTDLSVPAAIALGGSGLTSSTATSGSTSSTINDASSATELNAGLIGCHVRFTSGALAGQSRPIATTPTLNQMTVGTAFTAAPAAGDAYVVECPGNGGTGLPVASATTTTLTYTSGGWVVNAYRDADVVILTGTGAGQRRRIASNTATVLTLAGATTGNARTGAFATTPDATSTFAIVPSNDFLWYAQPTNTNLYRLDVQATTGAWAAWATVVPSALGGGSHLVHSASWAPFCMTLFRGAATSTVWRVHIGLQTYTALSAFLGGESAGLTTGGSMAGIQGRPRYWFHAAATQRIYIYNPNTGQIDPGPMLPYAVPAAYDGKRMAHVLTTDGVDFLYFLRAGGQEFWRVPMFWTPI